MKRLDKFSILIENEEMGREVKRISDKEGISRGYSMDNVDKHYSFNIKDGGCLGIREINGINYPLITFDQFKEMFEGEIIGYEAPFDIFGGNVKQGTPYVKLEGCTVYCPKNSGFMHDTNEGCVPKELIEKYFNPVFKQTSKTVMVGGKEWKVTKEGIESKELIFAKLNEQDWSLWDVIQVFGETATLSEIKNLVDTYKELNK